MAIYDELPRDENAFRIVRLQRGTTTEPECELIHKSLDESGLQYEAVSYTWGSSYKTDTVHVKGKGQLPITLNLWRILSDLRPSPGRHRDLWIDAICIDQENREERGHQVKRMQKIYSHADQVLFCIGSSNEDTCVLMKSLQWLHHRCRGVEWPSEMEWLDEDDESQSVILLDEDDESQSTIWLGEDDESQSLIWPRDDPLWEAAWEEAQFNLNLSFFDHEKQRDGLQHILGQDWFHRVWILQEVDAAKRALVYSGPFFVPARVFAVAPRLLQIEPEPHCQAVLDLMPGSSSRGSQGTQYRDLYSLLRNFQHAEATDERDKIYALLGMCTTPLPLGMCHTPSTCKAIEPDYRKSVMDIIHDMTLSVHPFCHVPNVQKSAKRYESISAFVGYLHHLENETLAWLINQKDVIGVQSFLKHFENYRTIPRPIINAMQEMMQVAIKAMETWIQYHQVLRQLAIGPYDLCDWISLDGSNSSLDSVLCKGITVARGEVSSTSLVPAADQGSIEAIRLLLNRGKDFEASDEDERTSLLILAVEEGLTEVVRLLLDRGVDPNVRVNVTPLMIATMGRQTEIVRLLLSSNADIEAKDQRGVTSLLMAVREKDTEMVRLLLDGGADPNAKDSQEKTPLLWAVMGENTEMVRLLLDRGADLEAKDQQGTTPLLEVASDANAELASLLLDRGADLEAKDQQGKTPLLTAVEMRHNTETDTIKLLLISGADIEAKDRQGRTPLLLATSIRSTVERIQLLLEYGADYEARDQGGQTSLEKAIIGYQHDIVSRLLDKGASIDIKDRFGETPLFHAIYNGNITVVSILLDRGADVYAKNHDGITPLELARRRASEYRYTRVDQSRNQIVQLLEAAESGSLAHPTTSPRSDEVASVVDVGANSTSTQGDQT